MNDTDSVRFCGAVFDTESVNPILILLGSVEMSLISNQ